VVLRAPLGSGHHYLVADARRAYGIETSGTLAEVWAEADLSTPGSGFHHENHCLGSVVAKVSSISPASTTLARHAFLEASLGARPIESGQDLWARLGSHDGFPRSVCTHLASDASPHAMLTCAGILLDLARRRVLAHPGCIHGVTPTHYPFASEAGEEACP
jgi:isopenicillin-N N-acyltransferase-like protein